MAGLRYESDAFAMLLALHSLSRVLDAGEVVTRTRHLLSA